jgi:DNA primase small subunit
MGAAAAAADNDEGEREFGTEDDDGAAPPAAKANDDDAPAPPSAAASVYARRDAPHPPSSSTSSSSSNDSSVVFSPELLGVYYSRLFPYDILHSWLSYDPSSAMGGAGGGGGKAVVTPAKSPSPPSSSFSSTFPRREFSMTIEPSPGQEVYVRYQSFSSRDDLAAAVIRRRPTKIDIGAVFSHPPKDSKSLPPGRLRTVERELVFDIDLTDYDAVRNCGCAGAAICPKCWTYMGMAMEVMDAGLREDFGFAHVAWFYSGRRGVHCWVCDGAARGLSNEARSAVASYFEVRPEYHSYPSLLGLSPRTPPPHSFRAVVFFRFGPF